MTTTLGWLGTVAVFAILGLVLNGAPSLCAQLDRLAAESRSGFAAIRAETANHPGEWDTSAATSGASYCLILGGEDSSSHTCTWEYQAVSGDASAAYAQMVDRVRACLEAVSESEDASVNHPDYWAATVFEANTATVTVSLKNKSALGKTLVAVSVALSG